MSYRIVRMYQREDMRHLRRVVKSGLTLAEAQAHCKSPETSSSTCRKSANVRPFNVVYVNDMSGEWRVQS